MKAIHYRMLENRMTTFSQSLRKCLICSFFCFALLPFHSAIGATAKVDTHPQILKEIQKDLSQLKSRDFKELLGKWEKNHGTDAVGSLLQIASNGENPDSNRYVAMMGLAKIGGKHTSTWIRRFLNDKSWMIRNGAIRALTALDDEGSGSAILNRLKDPAHVVRTEAVIAIGKLRPKGSIDALISTLHDKSNYYKGRAQFVPAQALKTLVEMRPPKSTATQLKTLLDYDQDPQFQKLTIEALETITGRRFKNEMTVKKHAESWKTYLSKS